MLTEILVLFQVLGFVSAIDAVLKARTPQGAIAWAVSLNTVAVAAVPAYWVFGRSRFHGYVNAWRDNSLRVEDQLEKIRAAFAPYRLEHGDHPAAYQAIKTLSDAQFLIGNTVELLVDGDETFDSLHEGIEAAESYVLFQFYILRSDATGNRFMDQLKRKAEQGVRVYVLYDELGSMELSPKWIAAIRSADIRMIPFNTRRGHRNRFQLNFRNHRKIVVVDGKTAWLGGLNIGDDYLGLDPKLTPWRDTHVRVDGPAAVMAQAVFLSDWHWAGREVIEGLDWTPHAPKTLVGAGEPVLVLQSGPADDHETASLFFTQVINLAERRIWIATPYFIPDEATMVALRLALLRGVEVCIVTPDLNDNWFVRNASNVYLEELARLGARVCFFQKGFMHQKTMLVDDALSMIGTVNFDNRSFRLNFEITAVVAGPHFADEVGDMLSRDLADSEEWNPSRFDRFTWWDRLKARATALLAPVL
jgi:cardiolipin synthase